MDDKSRIQYKERLKQFGLTQIALRIDAAKTAMDQAQEAANQEEKSSAGDKYETGRAMGQLQKEMFSKQLASYTQELAALHAVQTQVLYSAVSAGAFIDCGDTRFFIAAGLGKQIIDGHEIFYLSPQAPLARVLSQRKAGSSFDFNKKTMHILEVY